MLLICDYCMAQQLALKTDARTQENIAVDQQMLSVKNWYRHFSVKRENLVIHQEMLSVKKLVHQQMLSVKNWYSGISAIRPLAGKALNLEAKCSAAQTFSAPNRL